MEATNTEFHAHQFKPVLKMLSSPTGSLLIADEVGLGKTIEAGLIWTELKARFDYRKLLIVCPKVICEKWELELRSKFAVDARIVSAADILRMLENESAWPQGFIGISSLQGLRPQRGWRDEARQGAERASNRLARFLAERVSDEPLFDMVVVDEAHHLRNPETQSNQVTQLVRPLTKHLVFLSATPIHLRNDDLFSLLNLIDPETFRDSRALEEILSANRPLIEAREALLAGRSVDEVLEIANAAIRVPLLAESQQIRMILAELEDQNDEIEKSDRARLAGRLEQANLLANVINRTRRRDVEEFRVLRKVHAYPVEMGDLEREVYDAVTAAVRRYAWRADIPAGFLLSAPQRLLTSCLAAAIEHWRRGATTDTEGLEEGENGTDYQPLVAAIRPIAENAPDLHTLENNDSKFYEFLRVLSKFLSENNQEKVIVFSSFRPTIAYLERRLNSAGIGTCTIHGGTPDRPRVIETFRSNPTLRVMLSSEVGSEGIDLQFARTVVNYDLPWNPMKVEQRIGRVDRLGQASEFVTVINLFHRDTIDSEIYRRLYERLGLCERALGGFEAVLGAEIARLTPELLAGRLSGTDLAKRLDQTSQALEIRRKLEEQLEQEAVALIAHGDHVLRSIYAARDMHRWIDAKDLARYLRDALMRLYPGSDIRELDDPTQVDIRLSDEARREFGAYLDAHRLPRGRLFSGKGAVRCRLGRPPSGHRSSQNLETVTQTHPLVRFVSARVADTDAPKLRPAIAAKVRTDVLPDGVSLGTGLYVVVAQFWRFGGAFEQERIAYAGQSIGDGSLMSEDAAEALMLAAASDGILWMGAEDEVDLTVIAADCDKLLFESLSERFREEAEARQAELDDRAAIQMRTLRRRLSEQRTSLKGLIERQRARIDRRDVDPAKAQNVIRMNEGRLRSLEEKARTRETAIEHSRRQTEQSEQLAIAIIELIQ